MIFTQEASLQSQFLISWKYKSWERIIKFHSLNNISYIPGNMDIAVFCETTGGSYDSCIMSMQTPRCKRHYGTHGRTENTKSDRKQL